MEASEVTNGSRVSSDAVLNYTTHKKVRRAKEAGLSERKLGPAYQLGTQGASSPGAQTVWGGVGGTVR